MQVSQQRCCCWSFYVFHHQQLAFYGAHMCISHLALPEAWTQGLPHGGGDSCDIPLTFCLVHKYNYLLDRWMRTMRRRNHYWSGPQVTGTLYFTYKWTMRKITSAFKLNFSCFLPVLCIQSAPNLALESVKDEKGEREDTWVLMLARGRLCVFKCPSDQCHSPFCPSASYWQGNKCSTL